MILNSSGRFSWYYVGMCIVRLIFVCIVGWCHKIVGLLLCVRKCPVLREYINGVSLVPFSDQMIPLLLLLAYTFKSNQWFLCAPLFTLRHHKCPEYLVSENQAPFICLKLSTPKLSHFKSLISFFKSCPGTVTYVPWGEIALEIRNDVI